MPEGHRFAAFVVRDHPSRDPGCSSELELGEACLLPKIGKALAEVTDFADRGFLVRHGSVHRCEMPNKATPGFAERVRTGLHGGT